MSKNNIKSALKIITKTAKDSAKGPFVLPPGHKPAMIVPEGGSCCANCKFASSDDKGKFICVEPNYVKWNGDGTLDAEPTKFCSDWYEPKS